MDHPSVAVEIIRYVEDYPPGTVEYELVDADGRRWRHATKQVDVTDQDLTARSDYPQPGRLSCTVIEATGDRICIETLDAAGLSFTVPASSIIGPTAAEG